MKANNLTICVPDRGCDKNCPYCISHMTFSPEKHHSLMMRNAKKVLEIARMANVTSVLFTGKGEPFLNLYEMIGLIEKFDMFPIEIQTNGKLLHERHEDFLPLLHRKGVNTISISVDNNQQCSDMMFFSRYINDIGMLARICINVTANFPSADVDPVKFLKLFESNSEIRQLVFRCISIPKYKISSPSSDKAVLYIEEHNGRKNYERMISGWWKDSDIIRKTTDGSTVVGFGEMSVLLSDYCVQSSSDDDGIRSLIFHQDGHLYTSWDHPGSILF